MNHNQHCGVLTALLIALSFSGCADFFQDKIAMPLDRKTGSLGQLFPVKEEEKVSELPPPAQVFVEDLMHPNWMTVTWMPVQGALFYKLERAVINKQPDGTYQAPDDDDFIAVTESGEGTYAKIYGTSYTDKILNGPMLDSVEYKQMFYYRVSAANASAAPAATTMSPGGRLFPPPPMETSGDDETVGEDEKKKGVSASKAAYDNMVRVSWDAVEGAKEYYIYRNDFDGVFASVSHPRTVYEDTKVVANAEYTYYVVAVSKSGEKSVRSSTASGYIKVFGAPEKPANFRIKSNTLATGKDAIKIEWDLGTGRYVVIRTNLSNGAWVELTPTAATNGDGLRGTTEISLTDSSGLIPGIRYKYTIIAVALNGSGNELKSPDATLEAFVLSPPPADLNYPQAVIDGTEVTLRWKAALNIGTTLRYNYIVQGSPAGVENWTDFANLSADEVEALNNNGIIAKSYNNSAAKYRIIAVNITFGPLYSSDPTGPFAVKPGRPDLSVNDKIRGVYVDGLTGYTPNPQGVYPALIKWKRPNSDPYITYKIYRRTYGAPLNGAVEIGSISASADPAEGIFTFLDDNSLAEVGVPYYYHVYAFNALNERYPLNDSNTETFAAYGALTPEKFFAEYIKTMNSSLDKLINMNKSGAMDKLGDEDKYGAISGSVHYDTPDSVLSAIPPFTIYMHYSNYADYYIENNSGQGSYIILNGDSNTRVSSTGGDGQMEGTITVSGMYSGTVNHDNIKIKSQNAADGHYLVQPLGFPSASQVDWSKGKR
jgi:hypothetical protein